MKVLVAADGNDLGAQVSKRFGHAAFFLLVDSETWTHTLLEGVGEDGPAHGADRMQALGVDKIVTGNIGPNAFKDLRQRGVQVYLCKHTTAREAVESVLAGTREPAEGPSLKHSVHQHRHEPGHHEHGHHEHEHGHEGADRERPGGG